MSLSPPGNARDDNTLAPKVHSIACGKEFQLDFANNALVRSASKSAVTHQYDSSTPRILVISPTKNEEKYLEANIASLVAQTVRPTLWIIVDDGSTDRTGAIADEAAAQYPWIRALHRPQGTGRRVGPGVIEAFYAGLELVNVDEFDFLCKLDADLELPPRYFEELLSRFDGNPRLGTASGKVYLLVNGNRVFERTGDDFSIGAAKFYRRQCFQEIGGFVREVMWDGIDCHRCRMLGWEAASYRIPDLALYHPRPMGSSHQSIYHGRRRWGRGQYFMGTHPLYLLGITGYRLAERPWILGGLNILIGYLGAWITRHPQYDDPQFRRCLHAWQMQELKRRLLGIKPPPNQNSIPAATENLMSTASHKPSNL